MGFFQNAINNIRKDPWKALTPGLLVIDSATDDAGVVNGCKRTCAKYGQAGESYVKACENMCKEKTIDTTKVSVEEFVCKIAGTPQTAYNTSGYLCKGFNPATDSAQGLAYSQQAETAAKMQDAMNQGASIASGNIKLIIGVVVVFIIAGGFLYFRASRKTA